MPPGDMEILFEVTPHATRAARASETDIARLSETYAGQLFLSASSAAVVGLIVAVRQSSRNARTAWYFDCGISL